MLADVRFILSLPSGDNLGELSAATNRKLEFALDGAATATFDMPGDHPQAQLIAELATDVVVVRDEVALFRGRIGTSADTLTADSHACTFSAVDYRGMLDRRILWSDSVLSFRGVEQGLIAWQLIQDTQAHPGGALGITLGTGAVTGRVRDRDYVPGQIVGTVIQQLGEVIDGFDWEIDANRRFNVYYPQRGRTTGVDLVYGQQVSGVSRNLASSNYANAMRVSGAEGLSAVEESLTDFGSFGRFDAQVGNVDLNSAAMIQAQADAELATNSVLTAAYTCDLLEGWWDPTQLWLGDIASLFIHSGRLRIAETQRVVGLTITYDDAGGELVQVNLGDLPPSLTDRLGGFNSRLEVLERSLTGGSGYLPDMGVGSMKVWPGQTPEKTWAWADGTAYSAAIYPELFQAIGYTYGGSGDTFYVPDTRGRMIVGAGSGPGLTGRTPAATGGAETVKLTWGQNGPHYHNVSIGSASQSQGHTHTGGTSIESALHTHGVSGGTGGESNGHTHYLLNGPIGFVDGTHVVNFFVTGYGTNQPTGDTNNDHSHGFSVTSGTDSVDHTHTFLTSDVSGGHTHGVVGTTDTQGSGDAHENMPPFVAIGWVIRVLPPWRPSI